MPGSHMLACLDHRALASPALQPPTGLITMGCVSKHCAAPVQSRTQTLNFLSPDWQPSSCLTLHWHFCCFWFSRQDIFSFTVFLSTLFCLHFFSHFLTLHRAWGIPPHSVQSCSLDRTHPESVQPSTFCLTWTLCVLVERITPPVCCLKLARLLLFQTQPMISPPALEWG